MTSLLTRRDWTVLFLSAFDVFSEAQSAQILVLFLSANLGTDNQLGHWSIALIRFVQGMFIFLFGNYLSVWPGDGPLRALAYGNAMQIVFFAILVAVATATVTIDRIGYAAVLCLALILYAGGEAMGSVAFGLTVMKLCGLAPPQKQTAMMSWSYALKNVAIAAGGSGVPLLWRWLFAPEQLPVWYTQYWNEAWYLTDWARRTAFSGMLGANVACIVSGIVCWTVSSSLILAYHYHLARTLPHEYKPSPADVDDFLRPKTCRELWAKHMQRLRAPGMGLYVLVSAGIMFGVLNEFVDLGLVLPKYLIWRHGQVTWFPIFTAINPLLIAVLAPLVLYVAPVGWQLVIITVGTLLQFGAPLWAVFLRPPLIGIVVFIVQFTVGEAIAMPQLSDYLLRLIGDPLLLPYAQAIVQLPLLLVNAGQTAFSGVLLDLYCPSATLCGSEAELIWFIVAVLAVTTPLGFLLLLVCGRRRRNN